MRQGQPIFGANVHISIWYMEGAKSKLPNRNYTTDSDGWAKVEIPQKLKILRLRPSSRKDTCRSFLILRKVHDDGGKIPDKYEFRLPKGHELSGRIVDTDGKPIADVRVQVRVEVNEPYGARLPIR